MEFRIKIKRITKECNVRTHAEQKSPNVSTKAWCLPDAKVQNVESFELRILPDDKAQSLLVLVAEEANQNVKKFDVKSSTSFSSRFLSKMRILQL